MTDRPYSVSQLADLLTTDEVATMLRCYARTVRRLKLAYCKPPITTAHLSEQLRSVSTVHLAAAALSDDHP